MSVIMGYSTGGEKNERVYFDYGTNAPTKVGIQMTNHNENSYPYDTFYIADLIRALNEIPGVTATFEEPAKPLPTKLGIYVAANLENIQGAQVYKLKSDGWTDGNGKHVSIERILQINKSCGLVRLVPEDTR